MKTTGKRKTNYYMLAKATKLSYATRFGSLFAPFVLYSLLRVLGFGIGRRLGITSPIRNRRSRNRLPDSL